MIQNVNDLVSYWKGYTWSAEWKGYGSEICSKYDSPEQYTVSSVDFRLCDTYPGIIEDGYCESREKTTHRAYCNECELVDYCGDTTISNYDICVRPKTFLAVPTKCFIHTAVPLAVLYCGG